MMSIAMTALLSFGEPSAPDLDERPVPHVREDGSVTRRVHLQLDGVATWGIGAQMFLGTQVRTAALLEHWSTRRAIGTWDFAGLVEYGNEPRFLAPWIDPTQVRGAGHRLRLLGSVGHSVHMGARRRAALGLHVYGGYNLWVTSYSVSYVAEDVMDSATVAFHRPVVGGQLRFALRLHRNVGWAVAVDAPLPTTTSYIITLMQIGTGLTIYLR